MIQDAQHLCHLNFVCLFVNWVINAVDFSWDSSSIMCMCQCLGYRAGPRARPGPGAKILAQKEGPPLGVATYISCSQQKLYKLVWFAGKLSHSPRAVAGFESLL